MQRHSVFIDFQSCINVFQVCLFVSSSLLNASNQLINTSVVNIQTPYEIFIYVEGGISNPNLKAGWAERISARL